MTNLSRGLDSRPVVIKIGGRALEAPGATRALAAEVASLAGAPVLVHGGGAEVSAWCERLGLDPRFEDGLRVTDAPTLEVAVAVLAGLANKRLVAELRDAAVDAIGLAALDGIAEAAPHPRATQLGFVAQVTRIETALLETLLDQGRVPVLSSIAAHQGQLLNLNADDLATALAIALKADELILLSDTPGVRIEGRIVQHLDQAALTAALDHPDVSGGMKQKLKAAEKAIQEGVARVTIAQWSGAGTLARLLTQASEATRIEAASTEASNV